MEKQIRTNISSTGDQIVSIGTESKELTEREVDCLIEALRSGKEDSKAIKTALKQIETVRKNYNSIGKPIETEGLNNEEA